jgi:cytochrome c-type biogenesis protein CcmH
VRYRPPLKGSTLLLWFGPGLLFVTGLTSLVIYLRRRDRAIRNTPLTAAEQQRAEALLQDRDSGQGPS